MPLGDADLSIEEAMGPFTESFFDGDDPASGMPNYLFKPSFWAIGTPISGDPLAYEQHLLGPWESIDQWQAEQRQERKQATLP